MVIHDVAWAGPWQNEILAAIDALGAPEPVEHPLARPGELKYWVRFDAAQYDAAGQGPYRMGQIWERYLRPEAAPG